MFSINKKTLLIIGLVVVLVVVGYLNFALNKGPSKSVNTNTQTSTFFADFRTERQRTRQEEVTYLDSIVNNAKSDKDAIKEAQDLKLALTRSMEKEVTIEGLIKAKGFADAVVTIHENSINVVVKDKELTQAKVAQILDIVKRESGEKAENIKIIPST